MRRRGGRLGVAAAFVLLSWRFLAAPGGVSAEEGASSGLELARCGAPFEGQGFPYDVSPASCAGVFVAVMDPYLMEGLLVSRSRVGYHARSHSIWLDWRHVGHELYREDRLSAELGIGAPSAGFCAVLGPGVERRTVQGFGPEGRLALSLAASGWIRGTVGFGAETRLGGEGGSGSSEAALSILIRTGSFFASLERSVSGWRRKDVEVAVAVLPREGVSFLARYRSAAGELSSGLVVEAPSLVVGFFWSLNPDLGITLAAGVGRSWRW